MAVGIKDIAKKAGVSKATVSLALNNSDLVKIETKEAILEIARELDYIPDSVARSLAKSKSSTIGVVVPDIKSEYYGRLVYHFEDVIRQAGYFALLALSNDDTEQEERVIREFISKNVEGIIVLPINKKATSHEHLQMARSHGIPLIFASSYYQDARFDCVMADLEQASYELTKHILNSGRENILFLSSQLDNVPAKVRIRGIEKAYKEQEKCFPKENVVVFDDIDYEAAYQYIRQNLWPKGTDAIIAMNDMMALGVINALLDQGHRVPEEISVAGYDNVTFSKVSPITITTIDQNLDKISKVAVERLLAMIEDREKEVCTITRVRPKLVIREST